MDEFLLIGCIAYTLIDLFCHLLRWLPDWLAYDESQDDTRERHP